MPALPVFLPDAVVLPLSFLIQPHVAIGTEHGVAVGAQVTGMRLDSCLIRNGARYFRTFTGVRSLRRRLRATGKIQAAGSARSSEGRRGSVVGRNVSLQALGS